MKFYHRKAQDRGVAENGWLHARFTFSFADYYDPEHCGFHSLIVMNNDVIEPMGGFNMHPHDNAEIFTYVISGKLEHKDSLGNGSTIHAGNFQYMSAGEGITHSEFNPSKKDKVELYQIWMLPNVRGGSPAYGEIQLEKIALKNQMKILFSGDERKESSRIKQNAVFSFGRIDSDKQLEIEPDVNLSNVWIQIISGSCEVENFSLGKADGLGIEKVEETLLVNCKETCEFFLFQLPDSQ